MLNHRYFIAVCRIRRLKRTLSVTDFHVHNLGRILRGHFHISQIQSRFPEEAHSASGNRIDIQPARSFTFFHIIISIFRIAKLRRKDKVHCRLISCLHLQRHADRRYRFFQRITHVQRYGNLAFLLDERYHVPLCSHGFHRNKQACNGGCYI